jgi:hypothetical protein
LFVSDRVFLDANILYSAAYHPLARMRRFWSMSHLTLLTSTYAAGEAHRNLDTEQQQSDLMMLLAAVEVADYTPAENDPRRASVPLPEKDIPIFLAAIDLGATHLLTGDSKHFGPLYGQRIHGVLILPPVEY